MDPSWSLDTVIRWYIHYPSTRSSGVYSTPTHKSAYWAQLLFSGVLLEPLIILTKEFVSGSRGCLAFNTVCFLSNRDHVLTVMGFSKSANPGVDSSHFCKKVAKLAVYICLSEQLAHLRSFTKRRRAGLHGHCVPDGSDYQASTQCGARSEPFGGGIAMSFPFLRVTSCLSSPLVDAYNPAR